MNLGGPSRSSSRAFVTCTRGRALGDLDGRAAAHARNLALEVAYAGLARVAVDDLFERRRRRARAGPSRCRARPAASARGGSSRSRASRPSCSPSSSTTSMRSRQRLADRLGRVRGADEHHLRQIDRHLDVVVDEVLVLLGVEDLEHRRRRVAPHVGSELVDLVEHEHRVHRAGLLEARDDAAGQGADIRAAVAANLGFVAHAAERDAHVLAAERARNRLAERRLADAGRADEQEDRAVLVRRELAHRQELEDALLDLVEARVLGLEDRARGRRRRTGRR